MESSPNRNWARMSSFLSLDRNVLLLSLTSMLMNFGTQAFYVFIPLYLLSLGASILDIGFVYVGMGVATYLFPFLGGALADRFGRKWIIVFGNALGFGIYLALFDANTWTVALVVLLVATTVAAVVQPAFSSSIAESVDHKNRGNAFGTLYFLLYMGLSLGGLFGGVLPNPGKFQFNILVMVVAGFVAALTRGFFVRETLPLEARRKEKPVGEHFLLRRLSRNIWLVLIALFVFNFFSGLGQPVYAIFSTEQLRLSQAEFGAMVGLGSFAAMLGAFGAGAITRKLGVRNTMILSVIVAGGLVIPWIYSPSPLFAIAIFGVTGFFAQFFTVGNQTLMANLTKARERGSIVGFITTVAGLGAIISPYVGSRLWVDFGARAPFLLSVVLACIVAAPLVLIHEPRESES